LILNSLNVLTFLILYFIIIFFRSIVAT
jgi:hypothetical protein